MMTIRKATLHDLPQLTVIFEYARDIQKRNGNHNQWIDGYPSEEVILNDIARGISYVSEEDGEITGTFTFIIGDDPTYSVIEGEWLNDEKYGTMHRIASSGKRTGLFKCYLDWCSERVSNIRIDTHHENTIMKHLILKSGFVFCGVIFTHNGTQRLAYQKMIYNKNDSFLAK